MAARKLRGPDSRSPQSISSSMASVWQIYGVGSKLDQAKMSVFPNVAAQAWRGGRRRPTHVRSWCRRGTAS